MWLHTTSHVLLQLLPTFWTFKTKRIYKIIFSLSIVLLESKEEKCLLQTWGDVMISNYLHRKQMQVMIYRWTFNSIPFKHNFSILHETLNIKPHRSVNRHLMWWMRNLSSSQPNECTPVQDIKEYKRCKIPYSCNLIDAYRISHKHWKLNSW